MFSFILFQNFAPLWKLAVMAAPPQLKTTTSSSATRVRTAWFLVVTSVEKDVHEVHLGWKYSDNSVGFYSNSSKGSRTRPPWGKVIDCRFKCIRETLGQAWDHLIFHNGVEKKAFKLTEFNPTLWGINMLTSKILEMRAAGKNELLALYLSLLPQTHSFSQFRDGVHDHMGFKVDKSGIVIQDLESRQGSLDDFEDFVSKARQSCINVGSLKQVMEKVEGGTRKRKRCDLPEPVPVIKRSKAEKVEEAKQTEMKDKNGIEKSYVQNYIGRAEVPLDQLVSSKKVKLPINSFKVEGLSRSIAQRPDPALLSLTVCPAEGFPFDPNDLSNNHYEVIHGRHR